MPSKRKFFRTSFTFDVLSEEEIPDGVEIANILRECAEGEYVCAGTSQEQKELTGPEMAKALEEAASDAEFFQLTPEGDDLDDPNVIVCKRCGSDLMLAGWCEDDACPYSDWPQYLDFDLQADDIAHALDQKQKRNREDEEDFTQYKCNLGDESICEPCQTGVGECAHVAAARAAN